MIQIIDQTVAAAHRPLLRSMHADRKRLFVDLFGWDVPVVDEKYEIDQFDTPSAVYVIATDDSGDHAASLRLLPTDRAHMLDTLFSHLCPCGVPKGISIWESTRLCLPQRHGAKRRRELRNELISAMVDLALERGIERYTGVLPAAFRTEVLSMGWRGEPLGPAVAMPGGSVGAFLVHIDPDTPERLRWSGTYTGPAEPVAA
ncbi:acyl-homoserine-lactone synthase [Pelagerythrobacter aerophilus]|uniref:Acyl-homoserine-lactone synthase n=1 Tax=Pelagerythrobacter aerophilus TaxID=2306995 RepID=A0A418NKY3_9SPHN|nr:acyl-homoserine-lactone synthase [Pelagerythrobacter aerophilus]RIV80322.1 autoinducer synthase [Pelagerythrobacter aerophilus]